MGLGDAGTWDSWTPGRGTWDSGMRGLGTRGCEDLGLGDARTWDMGTPGRGTWETRDGGTRGLGTGDSKTLRLGDVGRRGLEDVINKQHMIFSLNLFSTIFGALEKGIICWRVCLISSVHGSA